VLELIWCDYNERADFENQIAELKDDLAADDFCLREFLANEAAFCAVLILFRPPVLEYQTGMGVFQLRIGAIVTPTMAGVATTFHESASTMPSFCCGNLLQWLEGKQLSEPTKRTGGLLSDSLAHFGGDQFGEVVLYIITRFSNHAGSDV